MRKALAWLQDCLFWWWGFWRWRPRKYATREALKTADAFATRTRRTVAYLEKNAAYPRRNHRDLLTGMVVALETGLVTRRTRVQWGKPRCRPASTKGAVRVGKPVVFEHRVEPKDPTKPVRIVRVGETEWV